MPGASPVARQRNPRGQGSRLRDEIMAGAAAILERTGNENTVTLRAVAREIGIAAPSIARHFASPTDIVDAVVAAAATSTDPAEGLLAAARAYVDFGRAHPNRYRVLFERRYLPDWEQQGVAMTATAPLAATFTTITGLVQACIDTGRSTATDANTAVVAIWFTLHGMIALPAAITSFAWPDLDAILHSTVATHANLTNHP